MNRVEEFCNQPCPEVICSELISKHKSKVVICGKYIKCIVDAYHAIKGITHLLIVVNVPQHDMLLSCFFRRQTKELPCPSYFQIQLKTDLNACTFG